jgi:hypothetical protein
MIGRSARNNYVKNMKKDKKQIGSSETLRETTFNFEVLNNFHLPQHKKKINQDFLEWFVGFSEGDGSFIISKSKTGQERLFFVLVQDDVQALHRLRTTLGFGRVGKHGRYFRYFVCKKRDIDKLAHLFNGNLVLSKTNARFIDWLKCRNKLNSHISEIKYKGRKEAFSFLGSAWLSGFIAAEGCFNITRILDKRYKDGFRIRCRFILSQKSEAQLLNNIKAEIGSGSISPCSKGSLNFNYTITDHFFIERVVQYLKCHPLRVKKNVSLRRMSKMLNYFKTKKEIPWEGKVKKRVLRLATNTLSNAREEKIKS